MDDELTDGYNDPCMQCGAVNWAVTDEGQFFCNNCHNVIERTKEVQSITDFVNTRQTSVTSGKRKRDGKGGPEWMICEGFQFILKRQAEALVSLGVCSQFKTDVLWNFWKRYLQKTQQAYTRELARKSTRHSVEQTSESEAESLAFSESSWIDDDASLKDDCSISGYSSSGGVSVGSGSVDADNYFSTKRKKKRHLMSMPKTLALCHLALLWIREGITLADLLRLVSNRHVPYINAHELFTEEMRFFGRDALLFKVESFPSYNMVHTEAMQLAKLMELPMFPPVTPDCLLHPALLSLHYLIDANLPDEMHVLVCQVIEKSGMEKDSFLTFNPTVRKPELLCYDLQAAALIIVIMKLLFKLDDYREWKLSRKTGIKDKKRKSKKEQNQVKKKKNKKDSKMFSLKRWFMIMQPALQRARKKEEQIEARRKWKSKKPIIQSLRMKSEILKRRRLVEQLQNRFHTLAASAPEPEPSTPSSFIFCWGKEDGADGPSLRHQSLDCVLQKNKSTWRLVNRKYWHTALRKCRVGQCGDHFAEFKPSFPRMYLWVLSLFSFMLGVSEGQLHKQVVFVERRLLGAKGPLRPYGGKSPRTRKKKAG
ncbi:TATA box-binding protein-associated factor RNA polymerase I subunit B [Trichomycterus rosablanca]|uniref:TATA box-binding protein-associated factor RNA polymerase I subunit B n=1 Tax=Trichomycterus rosablanca TaxID=2290929 RepID=UPI002F35B109